MCVVPTVVQELGRYADTGELVEKMVYEHASVFVCFGELGTGLGMEPCLIVCDVLYRVGSESCQEICQLYQHMLLRVCLRDRSDVIVLKIREVL